jgi:hypothetical protein
MGGVVKYIITVSTVFVTVAEETVKTVGKIKANYGHPVKTG